MKIGILNNSISLKGGSYQYTLSVLQGLSANKHELYLFDRHADQLLNRLGNYKRILIQKEEMSIYKALRVTAMAFHLRFPFGRYRIINDLGIDLLIVPQTAGLAGYYTGVPYIGSIPDIMHKYYQNISEYPCIERLRRDFIYPKAARNAVFTIVDSEPGKEDLIKFYKIKKEKIRIIPFIPPPYIYKYRGMSDDKITQLISKYNLPYKYLFYPAQFWFHKNHVRLVKALSLLKKEYREEIPIVFVGSDTGQCGNTMAVVNGLGMANQVYYLGYVSDIEMVALYKKANVLIFPSLFGPTNIPILEALILGTPVVCSNLFAMPDQVGDAGLLFDPFDIEDIAEKIYTIWNDEKLRQRLVQKGYNRTKNLTFENYAKKWNEVIEEAFEVIGKREEAYL